MAGEAPGGFGGDGGGFTLPAAGGGGFEGVAAGIWSNGGGGFGGFGGGMGMGDAGAAVQPMSITDGAGGILAGSDKGLEKAFSMGQASGIGDANLIIHKDGTKEWGNPIGPDNICKVWAEQGALDNPANVINQLNAAKADLANGTAVNKDGLNITGGKKGTFDVPTSAEKLPSYLKSSSAQAGSDEDEGKEDGTANGGGKGGGGGGGGGENQDGGQEDNSDANESTSETTSKKGISALNEGLNSEFANPSRNQNAHNPVNFVANDMMSSGMFNMMMSFDKDGDGVLSDEELAEWNKYKAEHADEINELNKKSKATADSLEKDDPEAAKAVRDFAEKVNGTNMSADDTKAFIGSLSKTIKLDNAKTITSADYENNKAFSIAFQRAAAVQAAVNTLDKSLPNWRKEPLSQEQINLVKDALKAENSYK